MKEILEKDKHTEEEVTNKNPPKQTRSGSTVVTSVSVSKEFEELTRKYNLSPTEVYRRGLATILFEMGDERYQTPLNRERLEAAKKFLEVQDLRDKIESIKKLITTLEDVLK